MIVERSEVPGYDATVLTMGEQERFVLRNPDDPAQAVEVGVVLAFDPPSTEWTPQDERVPYFTATGRDLLDDQYLELNYQFDDFGVLPPHVRQAVVEAAKPEHKALFEPKDYAPEEKMGPRLAALDRINEQRRQLEAGVPAAERIVAHGAKATRRLSAVPDR